MRIGPSYEYKRKFGVFLQSDYGEAATFTLRELVEFGTQLNQFLIAYLLASPTIATTNR